MKIKVLVLMTFLGCFAAAQEQKMTLSEIADFKKSVNAAAAKITTLSCDFVQYKHMDFLSKDIETAGKMYFSTPNLLKWQYKKPYSYAIIFKNDKMLIDDQGKKSSMNTANNKVFGKINKMIIGSVSGNMFDEKEFVIGFFKTKTHNLTRLVPKDAAMKKYIKQIELTFDPDDHTVVQVKLIESSADFTRILLKNKNLNAKIDPSVFVL